MASVGRVAPQGCSRLLSLALLLYLDTVGWCASLYPPPALMFCEYLAALRQGGTALEGVNGADHDGGGSDAIVLHEDKR